MHNYYELMLILSAVFEIHQNWKLFLFLRLEFFLFLYSLYSLACVNMSKIVWMYDGLCTMYEVPPHH